MADISDKSLSLLLGLAIVVSLFGILSMPNNLLNGFGTTDTGQVRINVTQAIDINVTQRVIDFGNGSITPPNVNCTMDSASGGDPNSCFTPAWGNDGPARAGLSVQNIGNTYVNITVNSTFASESVFWGGSGGAYKFKCNSSAAGATVALTSWTAPSGTAQSCIRNLSPQLYVELNVNITIPPTALGFYNDTVTFTAVKY